jgi:hypothetical protein
MRAKSIENGTMECTGGKIIYVSNDFCEEEFTEPIKELRAQYAKASNLTAYRQTTSVKARCQYKVRVASSQKTLVVFVCALPRNYCFQTPLVEKREVKFIRPLQKLIYPGYYYLLNEDMCAPGVIEHVDVSKGNRPPLYLPLTFYTNSEDIINILADVHNTSQIPTSCPCPGKLDVDGKLTYTVDQLFMALDGDPTLEIVCSSGGVAGNGVTATNLSSSALCTSMMATAKRNITKYLPAPYMRI